MNRLPILFLGVFGILAFSWTGLVLTNVITVGRLAPHFDEVESAVYPAGMPGNAARGRLVYQDLGCVSCHTQQVRRPGFGADEAREWGARQSVARDYLREQPVLIGSMRIGPDLRNVGVRHPDPNWHLRHLYNPRIEEADSTMPSYRFLFEQRRIVGQRSARALSLPAPHGPPPGYEIVPTDRAEALAAYLTSLGDTYAYPETSNVYRPEAGQDGEAQPEGGH